MWEKHKAPARERILVSIVIMTSRSQGSRSNRKTKNLKTVTVLFKLHVSHLGQAYHWQSFLAYLTLTVPGVKI